MTQEEFLKLTELMNEHRKKKEAVSTRVERVQIIFND